MKTSFILTISLVVQFLACGQTKEIAQNDNGDLDNTLGAHWYQMSVEGNEKITISDAFWTSHYETAEVNENIRIDTLYITKELDHNLIILKKPRNSEFALARRTIHEDGNVIRTAVLETDENLEVLEKKANKYKVQQDWEVVQARVIYSEKQKQKIESFPGFDEMKASDLKSALLKRKELGPLLKTYIEKNPKAGRNPYAIYRLAQPMLHREFIKLGYNPFKPVAHNFEETFKDDSEIIKLLTEAF